MVMCISRGLLVQITRNSPSIMTTCIFWVSLIQKTRNSRKCETRKCSKDILEMFWNSLVTTQEWQEFHLRFRLQGWHSIINSAAVSNTESWDKGVMGPALSALPDLVFETVRGDSPFLSLWLPFVSKPFVKYFYWLKSFCFCYNIAWQQLDMGRCHWSTPRA